MPQEHFADAPEFRALPGQVQSMDAHRNTGIYALAPQAYTATIGGTETDGVYSVRVNGITIPTTRAGGSPATNALLGPALAAVGEANTELDNVASFVAVGAVVTIAALHTDERLVVDNGIATAPGTMTIAETVPLSPALLPPGIGVIRASTGANHIRIPQSGDTDAVFQGVVERQDWNLVPSTANPAQADGYAGGSIVSVVDKGDIPVLVDETVAEGDAPFLRITGSGVGMFGNDAAAGARVAITGGRFVSGTFPLPTELAVTNAVGIAFLRLNRP